MAKYFIDHIYYALEAGFLNKSGDVPQPINGSDIHQAFNVCLGDIDIPKPKYDPELVTPTDALDPDLDLSYDKDLVPGKGAFPGGDGMIFCDPLFMQTVFTHHAVTGTWGTPGQYGKIVYDFSDVDDRTSIMIQAGMTDGSNPINRCYNGILTTSYSLGFKKGGILMESPEIAVAYFQPNTQAFSPNSNFDNGRWALWALKGSTPRNYHASGCKLFWDNNHAAELSGLKLENCKFTIGIPKDMEMDSSSLTHQHEWDKNRVHEAIIDGILYGKTEYEESEAMLESKTKKDLRMQWDQTTNETKWLQLDDAWIEGLTTHKLPRKENAVKIEYHFKGITSRFEGNYLNRPDPSTRINT